jgi:hypothetical protein
MNPNDAAQLDSEEIVELLITKLSECNTLVSLLGQKSHLDPDDLRKLRNELMFSRTKARHLAKELEDMKKPVNSFLSSIGS